MKKKANIQLREASPDLVDLDGSGLENTTLVEPMDNDEEFFEAVVDGDHPAHAVRKKSRTERDSPDTTTDSQNEDEESPSDIEVNMLVSSKHMELASPVFKAMLQRGGFREGNILGTAGSVEVPLPDDDPRPMVILLDIVHGHNRRVSRKVKSRTLASLAVLADKYQMVEALEPFSRTWINRLKSKLPTDYITTDGEKLFFNWMEISWVFGRAGEFKAMATLLERGGSANLDKAMGALAVPIIIIGQWHPQRRLFVMLIHLI